MHCFREVDFIQELELTNRMVLMTDVFNLWKNIAVRRLPCHSYKSI